MALRQRPPRTALRANSWSLRATPPVAEGRARARRVADHPHGPVPGGRLGRSRVASRPDPPPARRRGRASWRYLVLPWRGRLFPGVGGPRNSAGARETRQGGAPGVDPTGLSRYLLTGEDPDLRRRRWVFGLSVLGTTAGQVLVCTRPASGGTCPIRRSRGCGALRFRPRGRPGVRVRPFRLARRAAHDPDLRRDGVAGHGGRPGPSPQRALAAGRADRQDPLRLGDDGELAREEWAENRAFCAYCQTATLASFASAAFALPEALRAGRHPLGRGD